MAKIYLPGFNSDWGIVRMFDGMIESRWYLCIDGIVYARVMHCSCGRWMYVSSGQVYFFSGMTELFTFADTDIRRQYERRQACS